MRTIIAGSRSITDWDLVKEAIESCGWLPTTVLSGCARGVDQLGEQWAAVHNVPVERFPADWEKHGRAAGHKRNLQMALHAHALIAVWDGESPGTRGMLKIAQSKGLLTYTHLAIH